MKPDLEQDAADLFITLRCGGELLPMGEGIDLLETRLRAAYAAGMERAAEIADEQVECSRQARANASAMNDRKAVCNCEYEIVAIESFSAAIRAEKENDHG